MPYHRELIRLTENDLRTVIGNSIQRLMEDIDIKPENKGKFTATQKRTGKSTEELCHSKNPKTRKRANFARMAKRGWKPLKEDNDTLKRNVIEAFCNDIDFWFHKFYGFCKSNNIDIDMFYEEGGMRDIREIAEWLIDNGYLSMYELGKRYGVIDESINEGRIDDDERDPFEEYRNDYPNDDFDVSDMTKDELAQWCRRVGDFRYIYRGFSGWGINVANSSKIADEIVDDIYSCSYIEPTHEMDIYLENNASVMRDFETMYFCVFGLNGVPGGKYYIIYQQDKDMRMMLTNESKQYMTEGFKSNELRNWFKEHGGVRREYGPEFDYLTDKRVRQDTLGDVTDDQIGYMETFKDENKAIRKRSELARSNKNLFFTIYSANDGKYLLVGLDRDKVETELTWGGEMTKKLADRIDSNGWNIKTRSSRYVDDSDTYYYGDKAQDFGLRKSNLYKDFLNNNKAKRERMSKDEWEEYNKDRLERMHNYVEEYFPKSRKPYPLSKKLENIPDSRRFKK